MEKDNKTPAHQQSWPGDPADEHVRRHKLEQEELAREEKRRAAEAEADKAKKKPAPSATTNKTEE